MTGSDRAAVASRLRHVHRSRLAERAFVAHDPATDTVTYRYHPLADEWIGRAGRCERGGPW